MGGWELIPRIIMLDIQRRRGQPREALEEIDRIAREYVKRPGSGGSLEWFGGSVHAAAAHCLADLQRIDEARERWTLALADADKHPDPVTVLRVSILRDGTRFMEQHGPRETAAAWRAQLSRVSASP